MDAQLATPFFSAIGKDSTAIHIRGVLVSSDTVGA